MINVNEVKRKNRLIVGQSLLEITILLVLVATAFTVMQTYLKRGIQGKMKDLTEVIVGKDQQPYVAESSESTSSTKLSGTTTVRTVTGGGVTKTISESGVITSSSTSEDK